MEIIAKRINQKPTHFILPFDSLLYLSRHAS